MHLTATGTEVRRALVLTFMTQTSPTIVYHEWTPKGLCKS